MKRRFTLFTMIAALLLVSTAAPDCDRDDRDEDDDAGVPGIGSGCSVRLVGARAHLGVQVSDPALQRFVERAFFYRRGQLCAQ